MKAHIFLLTTKEFDLRILPDAQERVIHRISREPEMFTRGGLLEEIKLMLNELGPDFDLLNQVYIVTEPAGSNTLSAVICLFMAFERASIIPEIWLLGEPMGMFNGLRSEVAAATLWYEQHYEKRRKFLLEQDALSKLEE